MALLTSLCEGLRREIVAGILVQDIHVADHNRFFIEKEREKVLRKHTNHVPLPKVYIYHI